MLRVHNTLTRQTESFEPITPGHARLYVCGPTVYDVAHIGNARPVVVFDVLYRLLRREYERVTYVRNVTDVDDKIIRAARERDEPIETLTERTLQTFRDDMAALGCLEPDRQPRATHNIDTMIDMTRRLIERGCAYEAEGHVLFHVPAWPDYGKLSRQSREDMIAGARVEVAPYKRDPADFVLWKPAAAEEPGWESPWGRGRPGWHIECSAMSEKHLGVSFDIHGGGADLIFPHHENELAQSTCAHDGQPFVRYWMHNGFVMVEGQKMAKSLGNYTTVQDLRDRAPGEVVRLALLATHYRQPLDFTEAGLVQARQNLDRWYLALRNAGIAAAPAEQTPAAVEEALEEDLNTPQALSAMHEIATALNKAGTAEEKARLKADLLAGGEALGLLQQEPAEWLRQGGNTAAAGPSEAEIEELIVQRRTARAQKDFAKADQIRDDLAARGVVLEDTAGGTTWRRKT